MKREDCDNVLTINDIEIKSSAKTCGDIMKKGVVYLIVNNVDGSKYVGQTIQKPMYRWTQHKRYSRTKNQPLYKAIRESGVEYFTFSILEETYNYDQLNKLEIYYIAKYRSFIDWKENGYNLTTGGARSKYVSEETRMKLHIIHAGKPKTQEHNQKVGMANKGKPNARTDRSVIHFHNDITTEDFIFGGSRKPISFRGWDECDPLKNSSSFLESE